MDYPKNSPIVLFREYDSSSKKELEICQKIFTTTKSRMIVTSGDIVVGRYSVLPFYKELESDIKYKGAKLINSWKEHNYIADLKEWTGSCEDDGDSLYNYTARTWTSLQDVPENIGPVILKGQTNSRKEKWSTHMFANNKKEAIEVFLRLKDERFFENQDIYIREFIKFKTYFKDPINQQPITNEFRFFCFKQSILGGGFYWSNHVDEFDSIPKESQVPRDFLEKLMRIVSRHATFYVLDVAECENGDWKLVEINDGQMSGLSEVNPTELYSNLKHELWNKYFKQTY